jgi:predicted RND superfamily exporter protein
MGGPPADNVAIDEEGELTLYRLATLAAFTALALAWLSLRSVRLTLIVFACGLMSAFASLSIVWISGGTTDSFLLAMPPLVYVLAISGAVHLIKYYRDAIDEGLPNPPLMAIKLGWKPTLLCSVTTAIGLLALLTSDLTPVRKFGGYSACGVMIMLISLIVFLPAALSVWPLKRKRSSAIAKDTKALDDLQLNGMERFWQRLGRWIIGHHWHVSITSGVLIAIVGVGVAYIQTNIDLMKLFDSDARLRRDYQWLEENVAKLVPIEIVVRFDHRALRRNDESEIDWQRYDVLDRFEAVSHVHRTVDAKFGLGGEDLTSKPLSAITFVKPIAISRRDAVSVARRSVMNSRLEADYASLIDAGYLAVDETTGDELWRVSVRVAAFKDIDYGQFTERLREAVQPVVDFHNNRLTERLGKRTNIGASTEQTLDGSLAAIRSAEEQSSHNGTSDIYFDTNFVGVIPIIYKAQRELLNSLFQSTFLSFVTITPLLMLVSRGFWAGVTATLPNSLPVLVVFGGMGWLGIDVTIGSMMSASIALGVAVDDTIHYLTWFRRNLAATGDRRLACLTSYRRCATPTLQAALISGIGLSVFAFSTYTPTKQFGLLMLTILITGVVAELLLLPALLVGPLGAAFQRRTVEKRSQSVRDSQPLHCTDSSQPVAESAKLLAGKSRQTAG